MVHLHDILQLLIGCAIGATDNLMGIQWDIWVRHAVLIHQAAVIFLSNHFIGNVIVCSGNGCLLRGPNDHRMLVLATCVVILQMQLVLARVLVQLREGVALAEAFSVSATAILQLLLLFKSRLGGVILSSCEYLTIIIALTISASNCSHIGTQILQTCGRCILWR